MNEKQEMLTLLANGRDALTVAVAGVSEDIATRSPEVGRWSVLQCVEHVAVAEGYMRNQVMTATRADSPLVRELREKAIRERGADRARRVESPAEAVPTGRFPSLAEALKQFTSERARTMQFVENCNEDLRALLTVHPILGRVNCYEMLLMMALHPTRHSRQIEEIRSALS